MVILEKIKHFLIQKKKRNLDRKILEEFFSSFQDWPKLPCATSGEGFLIFSMTNWHYQIQQEVLFAYLAEAAGCKSYLAGYPIADQYWRQAGFSEERFLDWNRIHSCYNENADLIAEDVVGKCCTFNDLKEYRFDGLPIGQHVLSAIGRRRFRAGVDLANNDIRKLAKELLSVTIANVFAIRELMRKYHISQVLLNEPNYTNAGVSQEVLRNGGKFIQYVHSYEEGAFVFKRYGLANMNVHPISLSKKSWEILKNRRIDSSMEQKIDEINEQKYSNRYLLSRRIGLDLPTEAPKALRHRLGVDNGKKTAVIFSHVLWDANMFWGEDLFPGGAEEWLVETVRVAIQNKRMNWIVKIHPANVWKMETKRVQVTYNDVEALKEKIGPLPDHIHLLLPEHKVNPRSLFDITDIGITIRGTVGMELPALGIPVLTAGTGRYSNKGFTIDPKDLEEYKNYLLSLHSLEKLNSDEQDSAKKFFYGAFHQRPWRSSLYESICENVDPQKHYLRLRSWKYNSDSDKALSEYFADPDLEDYFFERN